MVDVGTLTRGETPKGEDEITRRSRVGDRRETDDRDPHVEANNPSPEEAIAEATRRAQDAERIASTERKRREDAERAAADAQRKTATTVEARVSDRQAAITSGLGAHRAAMEQAQAAMAKAMTDGDSEAFVRHQAAFNTAQFNVMDLERQELGLKALKEKMAKAPAADTTTTRTTRATETDSGDDEYSDEAKAWIAKNPRFNADPKYKAHAVAAHNIALQDGITEGSPAYFRFLDSHLEETFGKNHGTIEAMNAKGKGDDVTRTSRRASSVAAPRSSGGGAMDVGTSTDMTYTDPASGKSLKMTVNAKGEPELSGTIPVEWVEGAKFTNMKPLDYAIDRMRMLAEQQSDGFVQGLRTNGGNVRLA